MYSNIFNLKNMKKRVNQIRTLLNGESLKKPQIVNCLDNNSQNSEISVSKQIEGNQEREIDQNIMQKGLQSLDNPVLRGSFNLVLNEKQMDFWDEIATKAFKEIMSKKLKDVISKSNELYTIHLETDPGKIQNKRPGVYIIQNIENGMGVVGQTKNLRKRFNQYTSRGKRTSLGLDDKINKYFYNDVQQIMNRNLEYSQVFQRYVIYTWVDENKKPIDIDSSLEIKNQVNYLEHRLILALHECDLCYNINDVSPQLKDKEPEAVILPVNIKNSSGTQPKIHNPKRVVGPNQAKPFKIGDLYFYSGNDYVKYRDSLDLESRKKFLSLPHLRNKLRENTKNSQSTMRYLTKEEIQEAITEDKFYKPGA